MSGPYANLLAYSAGRGKQPLRLDAEDLRGWSTGSAFPLLPSHDSAHVFAKLRRYPRLDAGDSGWRVRPVREFDATNDKEHFEFDPPRTSGLWPVYKGASFNLWESDTGTYYAWGDPEHVKAVLYEKRLRQHRTTRSPFHDLPKAVINDARTLPCLTPRIAFRDITNRTNSRTVIAVLVPPRVFITNQAPYLLLTRGDEKDEAYLLGTLCSIPLDWYARRIVETHVNFHVLNGFPVPRPAREDPVRRRVEEIAGRLAAVDRRYAAWAKAIGVPVGSVTDAEKPELIAELDAAAAVLYGLDAGDVQHIFETFHVGWAYQERLDRVLSHFRRLQRQAPGRGRSAVAS